MRHATQDLGTYDVYLEVVGGGGAGDAAQGAQFERKVGCWKSVPIWNTAKNTPKRDLCHDVMLITPQFKRIANLYVFPSSRHSVLGR